MTDPVLAVVVINYETGDLLRECIRSLHSEAAQLPAEIVVVDNGSTDGSVARMRAEFPDVAVVDPGGNVGYAAAANRGIASVRASLVAVLNPDTVVEPGTLAAMRDALADPGVAAVGPLIRNADGSVYPSARHVPSFADAVGHGIFGMFWPTNPFTRRYRQLDADPTRPRDVDWVSGAAIFMRRDALDRVGGWDEGYFMYVEDVDLCWRLRRDGWRIRFDPRGAIEHVQGASAARRPVRMVIEHHRSLQRFATKRWRGPKRLLLPFSAVYLVLRAGAAVVALRFSPDTPRQPRVSGPKASASTN